MLKEQLTFSRDTYAVYTLYYDPITNQLNKFTPRIILPLCYFFFPFLCPEFVFYLNTQENVFRCNSEQRMQKLKLLPEVNFYNSWQMEIS
jgi:hypothetical protein